jgi:hypothetical protein
VDPDPDSDSDPEHYHNPCIGNWTWKMKEVLGLVGPTTRQRIEKEEELWFEILQSLMSSCGSSAICVTLVLTNDVPPPFPSLTNKNRKPGKASRGPEDKYDFHLRTLSRSILLIFLLYHPLLCVKNIEMCVYFKFFLKSYF